MMEEWECDTAEAAGNGTVLTSCTCSTWCATGAAWATVCTTGCETVRMAAGASCVWTVVDECEAWAAARGTEGATVRITAAG